MTTFQLFIKITLISSFFIIIEGKDIKIEHLTERKTFTASVYEHLPVPALPICYEEGKMNQYRLCQCYVILLISKKITLSYNKLHISVCNRQDALYSLMENLQVYAEQAKVAKSLGADIIVFPEVLNLKY